MDDELRFFDTPLDGTRMTLRLRLLAALAGLLTWPCSSDVMAQRQPDWGEYFDAAEVPELRLEIDIKAADKLREAPRDYVKAQLFEDGKKIAGKVEVKLKGAAGSYQDFDARPGLTVRVSKSADGTLFHGLQKFHLNNCAQDGTFLSEWLGARMFHAADYPGPRVRHVRLSINERDLGIYVLREGFDQPFVVRNFGSKNGLIYDGGFLQDIDQPLELDYGDEEHTGEQLLKIASACYSHNFEVRLRQTSELLDMDRFITFMAMERLCGHWDGYSLNCNNYRVFVPAGGKAVFLPHGMDQLFGDPGAGLFDASRALLARQVMESDSLREQYQKELQRLQPILSDTERWNKAIDETGSRITTVLKSIGEDAAAQHEEELRGLKERLAERAANLNGLINDGLPQPVSFEAENMILLTDWYPDGDQERVLMADTEVDERRILSLELKVNEEQHPSWRAGLLLPRGRYRFEATIKADNVIPVESTGAPGAGIRCLDRARENFLTGTSDWQTVSYDFEVPEDQRHVELVMELHARFGKLQIDAGTLKLLKR